MFKPVCTVYKIPSLFSLITCSRKLETVVKYTCNDLQFLSNMCFQQPYKYLYILLRKSCPQSSQYEKRFKEHRINGIIMFSFLFIVPLSDYQFITFLESAISNMSRRATLYVRKTHNIVQNILPSKHNAEKSTMVCTFGIPRGAYYV